MPIPSLAALKLNNCQPCAPTDAYEAGDPEANPAWKWVSKIGSKLNATEKCPICFGALFYCKEAPGFEPYGPYNNEDPDDPRTVEEPANLRRCTVEMLRPAAPYNNLLSGNERLEEVRPYFDGTRTGRVLFLKSGVGYHKECLYQFLKAQILQPAVWNGVEERDEFNGYPENEYRHFYDPNRNWLSYQDICDILGIEPHFERGIDMAELIIKNNNDYEQSATNPRHPNYGLSDTLRDRQRWLGVDQNNETYQRLMEDFVNVPGGDHFHFFREEDALPTPADDPEPLEPLGEAVSQASQAEYEARIQTLQEALQLANQNAQGHRDAQREVRRLNLLLEAGGANPQEVQRLQTELEDARREDGRVYQDFLRVRNDLEEMRQLYGNSAMELRNSEAELEAIRTRNAEYQQEQERLRAAVENTTVQLQEATEAHVRAQQAEQRLREELQREVEELRRQLEERNQPAPPQRRRRRRHKRKLINAHRCHRDRECRMLREGS